MVPIQTLILCGGQGTRIRGVADNIPKPMIEIGGRPIVWHIMKTYAAYGFTDFVLLLGYRADVVKEYFSNYRLMTSDVAITLGSGGGLEYLSNLGDEQWRVVLTNTGQDSMTGARIFRGSRHLNDSTFMATYGDGLANVDLPALLAFHRNHGKLATVTGVRPLGRFGELVIDEQRVVRFDEKPQGSSYINGGYFVFEREFVERYLSDDEELSLEATPLSRAAEDGELMVYRHEGFWQPMDTYRDWLSLNELWKTKNPPWKTWE